MSLIHPVTAVCYTDRSSLKNLLYVLALPVRSSACVLANTMGLSWAEWGPPPRSFLYHRAYFTSPLPLLVPKQQPLLVYLCVFFFALWFSLEQHNPGPMGDWMSGIFIQSSTEKKNVHISLSLMYVSSCPTNRFKTFTLIFFYFPTYNYYRSLWFNDNTM